MSARGIDFLDRQRVERAREVGGEAHRFGGAVVGAAQDPREAQLAVERVDRGRQGLGEVERVERAADAVVELGVADRDQPRQDQPAAAGADEGLGQRADGAVVGQQDAPSGERVGARPCWRTARRRARRRSCGARESNRPRDASDPAGGRVSH